MRSGGFDELAGLVEWLSVGFLLFRLFLGCSELHAEVEEPLEVLTGADEGPFETDLFLAMQEEASEAEGLFGFVELGRA